MGIRTSEQLKALFAENKAIQERKRIREQQRKYREKNRELIRIKAKEYRERNRDYIRKYDEARRMNKPLPTHDEYPPLAPTFKSKKEVEEFYAKWLEQLQEREPLIKGKALTYNIIMQESLKNMGRYKLTDEQIEKRYQDYKELLQELIERRKNMAMDDPNRENITRQISATNGRLIYYRKHYSTVIPEEKKKQSTVKAVKSEINQSSRDKFKEFEQKALSRIAIARQQGNETEAKILQERLEVVRLRVKYSFC